MLVLRLQSTTVPTSLQVRLLSSVSRQASRVRRRGRGQHRTRSQRGRHRRRRSPTRRRREEVRGSDRRSARGSEERRQNFRWARHLWRHELVSLRQDGDADRCQRQALRAEVQALQRTGQRRVSAESGNVHDLHVRVDADAHQATHFQDVKSGRCQNEVFRRCRRNRSTRRLPFRRRWWRSRSRRRLRKKTDFFVKSVRRANPSSNCEVAIRGALCSIFVFLNCSVYISG